MSRYSGFYGSIKSNSDSIDERRSEKMAEWCKEEAEDAGRSGCLWLFVLVPALLAAAARLVT